MFIIYTLKGEVYRIRDIQTEEQLKYKKLCEELDSLNLKIKEKKSEIMQSRIDMLDERQRIIFNNSIPKCMTSDEMRNNKKYLKRKELLEEYDKKHGEYIEP